jgi:HlyD family secretion protein
MDSTSLIVPTGPARSDGGGGVDDDPTKEIRHGFLIILAAVTLFGSWAAVAPLDAAATAVGQISVSGHNQIVQHLEGGVVSAVDVVEGQRVHAGQVLVQLTPEDVGAAVKALDSQVISLQAQHARLMAELQGLPAIQWPAAFATMSGDEQAAANDAMTTQQAQFNAGLGALRVLQGINARKAAGLREQIAGSQGQLDANTRQQALLEEQLDGMKALAAKGYAPLNSIRALERSSEDLGGAQHQYTANINDYRQEVAEAGLESQSLELQRRQAAAASLRDTDDQLNTLTPKLAAARVQLERGTLRAQFDGLVTGLSIFTPGSVVAPGQTLMEIVPSRPILTVEARLASSDIEGVHAGQKAEVRLLSMSARGVPVLNGVLTNVSADSFIDQRTGQTYYTAEVTVPKSQLDIVRQVRGADSAIRPGVPVRVMIPLRKRTALDYLFEPLSQALWGSFRQS